MLDDDVESIPLVEKLSLSAYGIPSTNELVSTWLYSSIIVTNELNSSWYLWAFLFASLNNS